MKTIIQAVISIVIITMLSIILRDMRQQPQPEPVYIYDTLVMHDTITLHDTIEHKVYVKTEIIRADTLWLTQPMVADTTQQRIEHRIFRDKGYRCVVSGINPKVERMEIYHDNEVIYRDRYIPRKPKVTLSAGIYTGIGPKGTLDHGLGLLFFCDQKMKPSRRSLWAVGSCGTK